MSAEVPIHGNYRGYYYTRPLASDSRLVLLAERQLFGGKTVLDVGCNEGWITCEIAQNLGARKVVGVDIDPTLIAQAWHRRRAVWSLQRPFGRAVDAPEAAAPADGHPNTFSVTGDGHLSEQAARTGAMNSEPHYFPACFEHMFGPLPTPPVQSRSSDGDLHVFPHNVSFRAADWCKDGIPDDSEGYDVVLAFSVSKWIHLNAGDKGLLEFFRRVHAALRPGGVFVLEPQDWASYKKAGRMHQSLRASLGKLEIRPDGFASILCDIGFETPAHLGSGGGNGGFDRPIDLYVKKPS